MRLSVVAKDRGEVVEKESKLAEDEIQVQQQRMWAAIEKLGERNADKDPNEVFADVTAIVEEVRKEQNAAKQAINWARRAGDQGPDENPSS